MTEFWVSYSFKNVEQLFGNNVISMNVSSIFYFFFAMEVLQE